MDRLSAYINDSISELRAVRWPTRQQAIRFSGVVIAFVAASAVFFGIVDFGLSELMQLMLRLS